MNIRIICDFDGTIAREDVTDTLLDKFAPPEWRDIEEEWKAGRIGSRECMLRQVDLMRANIHDIDECLDSVAIDPTFPAFVKLAWQHRLDLWVVSDGLDYAVRRVLRRFALHTLPIFANHLEPVGMDRYRLSFPHASDSCAKGAGTCKCKVSGMGERSPDLRILIGDGASDYCAAASVHLAFAKDKLLAHCRANSLPHIAFADFGEAARLLGDLLRHQPVRAPFCLELESQ